jgi:hypothetical protein
MLGVDCVDILGEFLLSTPNISGKPLDTSEGERWIEGLRREQGSWGID